MYREVVVSGDARERGLAHGDALGPEIESAIDFYAGVFGFPDAEVCGYSKHFRDRINDFDPAYGEEIEGIAAGAGVDPLWVYALNSRSELMSLGKRHHVNECTALYFRPTAMLGQNWDWAQALERLACLLRIDKPDRWVYMLTEPGIIGKIGMNSYGLGTCLNFLTINKPMDGVPVHIVLRAILDCASMEQAKAVVKRAGLGRAGNVLIGCAQGACHNIEFAGDEFFIVEPDGDVMVHTNHCVGADMHPVEDFPSSYARYEVADREAAALQSFTVSDMSRILSDRSDPVLPIYRAYVPDPELGAMGTVCSIVMDLPRRRVYFRSGNAEGARLELIFDGVEQVRLVGGPALSASEPAAEAR